MPSQTHPLASLLPPLRYACQGDFARLSKVRDLRSALLPGLRLAAKEGLASEHLSRLQAELQSVDDPRVPVRRAALTRLLGAVQQAGLVLPEELAALAQTGQPFIPPGSSAGPQGTRTSSPSHVAAPPSVRLPAGTEPRHRPPPQTGPGSGFASGWEGAPREGAKAGASGLRARVEPPSRAEPNRPPPPLGARAAATPPSPRVEAAAKTPARGGSASTRKAGAGAVQGGQPRALALKGGRTRRPSPGAAESRAEARLLSIAPREGPLSVPLRDLKWRLHPRLLGALDKKGLKRAGDVLFLLPRSYEDRRRLHRISELVPGERGVTVGVVRSAGETVARAGRKVFRATLSDGSGSIAATYFQTGPWLRARFPLGKRLVISGEVRVSPSGWEMAHPEVESAEDVESSSIHFNRIVPIYPGFERHEQRMFRELASRIAERFAALIDEPLPASLRRKLGLISLGEALERIHFPPAEEDAELLSRHMSPAHRRLAFDELFFLQLGLALRRNGMKSEEGISFNVSEAALARAEGAVPFQLTGAQRRVVREIADDMASGEPMNRLVQGDVGSGKTAVALVAALLAIQDGYQVALMAPTELLAEQHQRNFSKWLAPLGYESVLFTSAKTGKQRREAGEALGQGRVHVAIGTHALIEDHVAFAKLGLVVIDEQHRFGVMQRRQLMQKGPTPDVLVMTATPIPRTLAMTLYGDLDTSRIDELPPGRTPIETRAFGASQRARVYEAMGAELAKGHQAYVVYPLVEESEKVDLTDATQGAEKIAKTFPGYKVGLLHGRMKGDEKDAVMRAFRENELQILVCTTVVEVGVDVPNASVMVIESAERFGLSQLHQLRGRVGRGAAKSYCFLVAQAHRSMDASERLAVMERSSDGVVIAEKDLELRGPGEFLGTRQSGMPELAVANLARDGDLLQVARREAMRIVAQDPALSAPEHEGLARALEERWEGRLSLAKVG